MKNALFFSMIFILLSPFANAQDYHHGLGLQLNYGIFKTRSLSGDVASTDVAAVPGLMYKSSLAFDLDNSFKLALSAYPFLGLNGTFSSQVGVSNGASIGAELPILGELYLGDLDDGCFFLGAGFSAAFLGTAGYGSGAVVGPQVGIGGQFWFLDNLVGLRASYTHGLNTNSTPTLKRSKNMLNFSVYYLLGQ